MMRRCLGHILVLTFAAVLLFSSCGNDEAKVIPRGKLAEIYAEMLLTDQWVVSTPNVRMIADTSLVYDPILERYGYDSDDYRKSVDVYMDDPERFARIFRESGEILKVRLDRLQKQRDEIEKKKMLKAAMEKFRPDINFEEMFPYLNDEPYVHYYDSLSFEPDSSLMYRLVHFETSDTLYDGIRMVIKDTIPEHEVVVDDVVDDKVDDIVDTTSAPMVLKADFQVNPRLMKLEDEGK